MKILEQIFSAYACSEFKPHKVQADILRVRSAIITLRLCGKTNFENVLR